ncbi:MAG: SDR family oxidoreductase [Chloroflexi bacterium]|nr:MAG: SDR family oxidoreductase [Chloroflexota bacterium]
MVDYRSMFRLDGRTALVVGAGSGIGQASACALAAFGARVYCADVNAASANETMQQIRAQDGEAEALALDIRDSAQIRTALDRIEAVHPLDILVSTPSINVRKPFLQISDDEFERVVGLNLKGTFMLMREVARGMAERGRGSIVVFASIRADVVEPGQSVYAATKAGTRQLARTLASELGTKGVRVNTIAPGVVETPLTAPIKARPEWYNAYAQKSALQRWATADEMTGAVVYLASDASSYVTGSVLFVDGGWTAQDGRFVPHL